MRNARALQKRRAILCIRLGHPKVVHSCFGYITCARCGEQLGDNLAGGGVDLTKHVVVGHKCEQCQRNARALRPSDRWLLPKEARADTNVPA